MRPRVHLYRDSGCGLGCRSRSRRADIQADPELVRDYRELFSQSSVARLYELACSRVRHRVRVHGAGRDVRHVSAREARIDGASASVRPRTLYAAPLPRAHVAALDVVRSPLLPILSFKVTPALWGFSTSRLRPRAAPWPPTASPPSITDALG